MSNIHALFINAIDHQHFLLMDKESCCLTLLHLPSVKHVLCNDTLSCGLYIHWRQLHLNFFCIFWVFLEIFLSITWGVFPYFVFFLHFLIYLSFFSLYIQLVYHFFFGSRKELWLKYDNLSTKREHLLGTDVTLITWPFSQWTHIL